MRGTSNSDEWVERMVGDKFSRVDQKVGGASFRTGRKSERQVFKTDKQKGSFGWKGYPYIAWLTKFSLTSLG
jgi:hypothetical protein